MALTHIITSSKNVSGSNFNCYFLPKALIKLKVFRAERTVNGEKKFSFRFEHELLHTTDTEHRYYLQYHPSSWTDDTVSVEFTPEGFLSRVHTVTEDQTGAVLEKLAELARKIAETVAGVPEFMDRDIAVEKLIYEVTFDPNNSAQVDMINSDLKKWNSPAQVRFTLLHESPNSLQQSNINPEMLKSVANGNAQIPGIFCRPLAAGELEFYTETKSEKHYMMIPHPHRIHYIEILRPRWIKFTFSMEFEKGFPKNISLQRPSQALAIASIPLRILSAIFAIPAKLIPFSGANTSSATPANVLQSSQIQQQVSQQTQMLELQKQLQTVKQENVATTRALRERALNEDTRQLSERGGLQERSTHTPTPPPAQLNPKFKYFEED